MMEGALGVHCNASLWLDHPILFSFLFFHFILFIYFLGSNFYSNLLWMEEIELQTLFFPQSSQFQAKLTSWSLRSGDTFLKSLSYALKEPRRFIQAQCFYL